MNETEEIKVLLTEIRDAQRAHHEEWKRAHTENQQVRDQAVVRLKQARRSQMILWIVLAVLAASILLPLIAWRASWAIHDLPH